MSTPRWPLPALSSNFWGWRGIQWGCIKRPTFSTTVQLSYAGRRAAMPAYSSSLEGFTLNWWGRDDMKAARNATRIFPDDEFDLLCGHFRQMKGRGLPWLFMDPTDHYVVGATLSASTPAVSTDPTNPTSRVYQVVRPWRGPVSGIYEPVGAINEGTDGESVGVITSSIDGVMSFTPNMAGSVARDGWITLATAPTAGSVLTGTFSYYFRVAFKEDAADFELFYFNFVRWKKIDLEGARF